MVRPVHSKRKLFNNNNNHKEQKENEPEGTLRNIRPINSGHSTSNSYTHNLNNNHSSHNNTVSPQSTTNLNIVNSTSHGKVETCEDVGTLPCTPGRPVVMPMSERQQIALLKQMSSPSPPDKFDSRSSSPRTPNTPNLGRGVNKRNERGETPLHVASIKGDTDRVSQLISQGADVNATDYAGWSGLHEACNRGFYGVSKLLIEAGADVNAKGLDNDTPLHDACINNHFKLVRLLLKCGAGVDVVNRRGKSPRDVSRSPGIVSLIEQAAKGDFESFGNSSGEDIAPQTTDLFKRMSRRTPPTTKPSDDKPGGPGSPRVTLRLQTGVARTPDKGRLLDNKNSMDSEDVYEFKVGKDEGKGNNDPESKGGGVDSTTDEKSEKRSRDGELESDEDARNKRRKEDNNKESSSQQQKQQQQPQQSQQQQGAPKGGTDKGGKSGNRGTSGGNNSTTGVSSSTNSNSSNNSGNNSATTKTSTNTSGGNGSNSNISSTSGGAGGTLGTASGDKKSPMTSAANSPKPTTTKTGESSDTEDDVKSESSSGAGPKVPPLKIVLGGATEAEQSTRNGKNNVSRLPYVVNTTGEEKDGQADSKEGCVQVKIEDGHNSNSNSSNGSSSEKASRITRSRGTNNTPGEEDIKPAKAEVKVESPPPPPVAPADHIIHPRKRKIKIKEPECEPVKRDQRDQRDPVTTATTTDQPATNCYETFLKIRKQIERRRESLRPVQPKPPQDFENYLMNRCSYVLAGNASTRLSVPKISPPSTLTQPLKDLFNDQEKERYRLRLQHTIEKEKLVLSVEQEILRVHGRAARALANQALPFSVCTLLKDEEVYNVINPEQEKDGNARSRYNGRLFLSWLQDVDDKWEKIKEHMVLRHHHEAESLHAVQRMDWEWKMRELRMIEHNQRANIDEGNVPQVTVSDDFDLLPA